MGLTHYWRRAPILPLPQFQRAVDDCQRILPQLGLVLTGGGGVGKPVLEESGIIFAGRPACECFVVRRIRVDQRHEPRVLEFCKTRLRPYDLAVRAALIVLQHHLPEQFEVASDDRNWRPARALCQQHLGYGQDFQCPA